MQLDTTIFKILARGTCTEFGSVISGIPPHSSDGVCGNFKIKPNYKNDERWDNSWISHEECIFCKYWKGISYEEARCKIEDEPYGNASAKKKKYNRFAEIDIV
jgi:hypothetical protein